MIDVVVAVVRDAQGKILLSRRQAHQDFAHHWEFPGGKQEANESLLSALQRELAEELGLSAVQAQPWMCLPWQYAHKSVRLHVFLVEQWQGEPQSMEGQPLAWFTLAEVAKLSMPEANGHLVAALVMAENWR